jgi:LPS export ABC transporter protein LptC
MAKVIRKKKQYIYNTMWQYLKYFFLLNGLLVWSCANDLAEIEKVIQIEDAQKEVAHDVRLLYSDSAEVKVEVLGAKLVRYLEKEDPREEFPEGITVNFLTGGKKTNSVLTSKFAVRYEGSNQITVRDSVVWISKKGEKLETEELIWDEKNKKVFSSRYVRITNPEEVIFGYGFDANQDFTEWRIKQIEGRMRMEDIQ